MLFQSRCPRVLGIFFLGLIYILAWTIQERLFLNYDVSWLMQAVKRMLAGGTYARDFFETNPPLILYLYLPPVILSKAFTLKLSLLFRGYLFLLASLSLGACYCLLNKLFKREPVLLSPAFFLMLAFVYLVLPCYDFGQREHLLVLLTLPYFLLVVCRLQKEPIPLAAALSLGFVAGLGFAIKPHFLMALILIEVYAVYYKKDKWAWARPETLSIVGVLLGYALLIFFFYPDYLYIIVPYSLRLYYSGVSQPWADVLLNGVAVYCGFPVLLYLFQYKETPYKVLSSVLLLGLLGFLLSYYTQQMVHYYHLIPALSFALLLLVVELGSLGAHWPRRRIDHFFALMLGLLLFSVPLWIFYNLYSRSLDYKQQVLSRLAAFMNEYAKEAPVYFFVTAGSYAFPTVEYTSSQVAPRFYFLWMAAGLANQSLAQAQRPQSPAALQYQRDKNFLINMIADDLYLYKPRYIFIDQRAKKYRVKDEGFDYLTYFSENPKFRQEWRNYRYFTTLEEKGFYKLGVYSRK